MPAPFGLCTLKIHLGASNVCLLPRCASAREKGSREREQRIFAHDECQPCQSAAVVRKQWPLAQHRPCEMRGRMREKMGSKRRLGPELLSVELIDWLQACVLTAALYLCYPQHRLPSSDDWHEIQTHFDPLEVAIT